MYENIINYENAPHHSIQYEKYPENIKVTDFHLTKVKSVSTFPTKVIKKIINAVEPHHILSSISVEDFINMDQQRFDKFKNV